jgi:hypothetical protein
VVNSAHEVGLSIITNLGSFSIWKGLKVTDGILCPALCLIRGRSFHTQPHAPEPLTELLGSSVGNAPIDAQQKAKAGSLGNGDDAEGMSATWAAVSTI